jgi:hypothetical protein
VKPRRGNADVELTRLARSMRGLAEDMRSTLDPDAAERTAKLIQAKRAELEQSLPMFRCNVEQIAVMYRVKLEALQAEGFSRAEAMQLLLADAARRS